MPRSTASIQAEIDAIEAQLPAVIQAASYSTTGRAKTNQTLQALTRRLDALYLQLGRASGASPMQVRGTISGLG